MADEEELKEFERNGRLLQERKPHSSSSDVPPSFAMGGW